MEMVRSASLSDKDVQTLTEILSNRQGTTGVAQDSWNKVCGKQATYSMQDIYCTYLLNAFA